MRSTMLAVAGALAALAGTAQAQTFVANRAALNATGHFDWSVLGATFTDVANPTAGIAGTNTGGITATVSKETAGPLQRRDEGNGWFGSFALGDALLFTNQTDGFLRIEFSSAVEAVGAQIHSDRFGAFTGFLRVFSGATLLDTFSGAGNNTGFQDNSALFLGAEGAPITAIEFDIDTDAAPNATDFAINRLSIRTSTVPEPSTYALLATGLVALAVAARRRRSA